MSSRKRLDHCSRAIVLINRFPKIELEGWGNVHTVYHTGLRK